MRAVLDPGVIVSGLLAPKGGPASILRAWEAGEFELIVSPLLLTELERALSYPKLRKRIPQEDAVAVLAWLRRSALIVRDPPERGAVQSADPDDDYLIALAEEEQAALVSGDAHLLALAGTIPVLSARQFLELLG